MPLHQKFLQILVIIIDVVSSVIETPTVVITEEKKETETPTVVITEEKKETETPTAVITEEKKMIDAQVAIIPGNPSNPNHNTIKVINAIKRRQLCFTHIYRITE